MKKYKQKPSSSEEMVKAIVREGSPGRRSETTWGRICKNASITKYFKA